MSPLKTVRNLRVRYIVGLSIIALLISASYFTMQKVVSEQRNFSNLLSLAGHQSGLVNRIAYFSSLMAATDDEGEFDMAKSQVGLTINKLEEAHQALRYGSVELGIPKVENEVLQGIYEDEAMGLEKSLGQFLEKAKAVYNSSQEELSAASEAYIFLTIYGPHALEPLLETAVDEYKAIGRAAIVQIERFEFIIWCATLVTLLFELFLIFRPLEQGVSSALTSLQESIADLKVTRKRLLSAQQMALVGDWQYELATGEVSWSEQVYSICGIVPEKFKLTVLSTSRTLHPEDRILMGKMLRRVVEFDQHVHFECRVVRPDGQERLVLQKAIPVKDEVGRIVRISGTIQDITERKELSIRLEKQAENVPGFIFQFQFCPEGVPRFTYASKGSYDIYGFSPERIVNNALVISKLLHGDDAHRVKRKILISSQKMRTWRDQFRVNHPVKGEIWVEGHATPERLSNGDTLWYGYLWDITERKRQEEQIRHLALFDPLTNLANRRLLKDRLSHALLTSHRQRKFGAVLMLDLDNFKTLNDTRGHNVGDALLVEVGQRLQKCVRDMDTVSRLGGDEFVVLLEWLGRSENEARKISMAIAEKIRLSLGEPYVLGGEKHVYNTSASIGVALFQGSNFSGDELVKQADVAMFEAKELGRNRVCLFRKERQVMISSKSDMADDLLSALDNNELFLHYQPQVDSKGRIQGVEALLRWQHSSGEWVSPGRFIPIAEETGLIIPIGEWVLETACKDIVRLSSGNLPDSFAVAVNISARQFSDEGFLQKIRTILAQTNVQSNRIKLELTETSLAHDISRAQLILEVLHSMGLRIELDDFGTGYSSLTSLKNLPLTTLKIDSSLVHGIGVDTRDESILRAAIAMAKALGLEVIAEGVETKKQQTFLLEEQCNLLQGFLFSKALPFSELVHYLNNHQTPQKEFSLGHSRKQKRQAYVCHTKMTPLDVALASS